MLRFSKVSLPSLAAQAAIIVSVASTLAGCATESFQALEAPRVQAAAASYNGVRTPVAVGKFNNLSDYMRGVFSSAGDQISSQARTVLVTHLDQSRRFIVLDRNNLQEAEREASLGNTNRRTPGAAYLITGDITEFGRKEVGDTQLFGILGRGKKQVAYAKVALNIVSVADSRVVLSAQGAGEYALSTREVIGFGGTASYDSTLNGKVIDLAIREAVDKLVKAMDDGEWKP